MTSALLALVLVTTPDSAFHFTAGLSAGLGAHTLSSAYAPKYTLALSLSAVVLTAGGKELFDLATGLGTPDHKDFLWSVAGGLVGIGVSIVLQHVFMSLSSLAAEPK